MKRKLIIQGNDFFFNEENLSNDTNEPISIEDARMLLNTTKKAFSAIGLDFYLAFGTLLGAIREKSLIKNDEDVDVFIDDEELLYNNLPFLEEQGMHLIRCWQGDTYTFRMSNNSYIDVYILKPWTMGIWKYYCHALCNLPTPKKYFKEYQKIVFLGVECMCPKNPEKLVAFWYGKNWRTPVRGHKFIYEARSHYYYIKYWKGERGFYTWFAQNVIHKLMVGVGLRKK